MRRPWARTRGQYHEPQALTQTGKGEESRLTLSSTPAGTTMGRNDSEWGQMGVIMMAGTLGWIMEAPAAAAYAVLPVGVETITPEEHAAGSASTRPHPVGLPGCPQQTQCPHTITLHRGDEVPVQVDVYVGQVGGGASVNHHLIQDLGAVRPCTLRG